MSYRPIEDYAVIGDGLTAALVSRDGSIDWACFPRFDAPSVFGRILDAHRGGYFQAVPDSPHQVTRRYLEDTNVLETRFVTATGDVEAVDFMPASLATPQRGTNRIIRRLRGQSGTMQFSLTFDPRFDYGRRDPTWELRGGWGARALNAAESLTLYTDLPLALSPPAASARFTVAAGDERWLVLEYRSEPAPWSTPAAGDLAQTLGTTCDYWRQWANKCRRGTRYADAVRRSALVLKLLGYAPTGAIVAAPTTSLPEHIGGVRNWDYRYAWVRDSAFVLYAHYLLGQFEEGAAYFDWLLSVVPGGPESLQVLYGVEGERRIDEHVLEHLEGYERSAPVRIGNAAYSQHQLDLFGDLLDCAYLLNKLGRPISPEAWPFLAASADHVLRIWHQPDLGIWEMRGEPQHFVYSKAQAWVALTRAAKLARASGLDGNIAAWEAGADTIMREILEKGVDPATGSFVQAYGSDQVDASLLCLQLRKVIKPGDPRMLATIDRITRELDAAGPDAGEQSGLIRRYRTTKVDDGLPPGEGLFLMCSFWLVDCYAESGRVDQAQRLFERLLGYANDVGLYAEEFDPKTNRHLGNFPQAFTHVALINAAAGIEDALRR
ncbi:MAG: glycoside hydrolase family 15 protein [Acidobacteriota bacterium]|nr:glycoside hydrolase family 15 protein [Acidobacteriota bacterium]